MRTNVTVSNLHDIITLHTMEQEKRHFDNILFRSNDLFCCAVGSPMVVVSLSGTLS